MTIIKQRETVVWVLLISLTLGMHTLYQLEWDSPSALFLLSISKFILIFNFFMHMSGAHKFWQVIANGYLFLILIAYLALG